MSDIIAVVRKLHNLKLPTSRGQSGQAEGVLSVVSASEGKGTTQEVEREGEAGLHGAWVVLTRSGPKCQVPTGPLVSKT